MKTIPFLWTNDDITFGQADALTRMRDFLGGLEIPGTFFVVPIRSVGTIDQDADLLAGIAAAELAGHEFHQHGTRHTPFECGVPDIDMLEMSPEVRRSFDEKRFEIEASHELPVMQRALQEGQEIWRRAFGSSSRGFRPGWGAFHGNLYRALDALGFDWVSARIVSMTSWRRNNGQWDAPLDFREGISARAERFPGTDIYEIPMTGGEYAFKVPNLSEKIESMIQLGCDEFDWCYQRDLPFVMVSHERAMAASEGAGYEVHRRLLKRIKESGKAEFMTMNAYFDRTLKSEPVLAS